MDAAGRFACCVQTGNRITLDVENLGFFVDFKTAHGVVNARPQTNSVEGPLGVEDGIFEEHAVEFRVLHGFHIAVEFFVFFLKGGIVQLVEVRQRFEVVEFTNNAVLECGFKLFGLHVFADDFVHHVGFAGVDDRRFTKGNNGISANFTVAGFFNEALAGCRVNHGAVADHRFHGKWGQTEAVFVGRSPGAQLDPVHVDGIGA